MRIKKTVWTFFMIIMAAMLVLIINSRVQLTSEVVVGGADSVFVKTDGLKEPMDEYQSSDKVSLEKYTDLEFPVTTITEWQYILINSSTPIKSYAPAVKQFGSGGPYVDKRIIESLSSFVSAAKEAGFEPYISAGYRSYADQQQLFNEKASELSKNGAYTYEEAQSIAAEIVAKPGTSDHQTGLAVDILDKEYEVLDYSQMDTKFFDWLDANCAQFGFIKRYPGNKKSVTGWDEPWHYRYVGKEAAEFIMKNGMCLEEFVAHYK